MEGTNGQVVPVEAQVMLKLAEVVGSADYAQLLHAAATYEQQVDSIIVENEDQEKVAVDSKDAVKGAYKRAEELRLQHVGIPTKIISEINKIFKSLKDSFKSTEGKIDYKVLKYREKRDAEIEAARTEYEKQKQAAEGVRTCATCLSVVRHESDDSSTLDCYMYKEGVITVVHENFTCDKWHQSIDGIGGLPTEGNGEPTVVQTGPPPPPEMPENVTKTASGAKAHTRKQWTFKVKDFGKFVRAVGSPKKAELVPEDLLEVKRGEVLKLIRREQDPVRKIPGLKIFEEKVLV